MSAKVNSSRKKRYGLFPLIIFLWAVTIAFLSGSISATKPECDCAPKGRMAFVERVIDGDTIVLEGGERVRYIGIDTPESVHPRRPVEPFAIEAAKLNKNLVEGKRLFILTGVKPKGRYGRTLAYVFAGDVFVNARLVKEGLAREKAHPPNVTFQPLFVTLQDKAEFNRKSIWSIPD